MWSLIGGLPALVGDTDKLEAIVCDARGNLALAQGKIFISANRANLEFCQELYGI